MRALQHSTSAGAAPPSTPPRTSLSGLKSLSGRLDSPVSTKALPSTGHSRRQSAAGEMADGSSSELLQRELLERSFCAVAPAPPHSNTAASAPQPAAPSSSPVIRLPPRKQQRRPRMPAPEPLPVLHSSTYLSSKQRYSSSGAAAAAAADEVRWVRGEEDFVCQGVRTHAP